MLGILGTTALLLDGGPDDRWGPPKARAVLATLAVHAGQVVTADKLLRWVWPDGDGPEDPRQVYDTYATRIRHALGRLPSPPDLCAGQGGYQLRMDRTQLDLHQFRGVVAEARKHVASAPARAVELVEGAIWLWRGEPLADLTGGPAQAWRERVLRTDWLAAHTLRIQALIELERFDEALAALDAVQTDHPADVTLANLRLSALYESRRIQEEIGYFVATLHRFRADGDDRAARHLHRHHSALTDRQPEPITPRPTTVPRQLPHDVWDFVGRRDQLAALDEACAGPAGTVVLHGAGGVGKSTLAVRWAHRARDRFPGGDLYVDLCGSAGTSVDPVVDDFLRALGQPPDPNLPRRQRERLLNSLLAERKTLVLLDNARDTSHVRDLVEVLSSCTVIVTSRRRMTSLRGATRISVPPMPHGDASRLLSLNTRGDLPDADRLVDLCGGLPLMITVLARDLSGRPAARPARFATCLDRGEPLVAGEACFASSYHRLAPAERRLFRLLSLHPGPDFSAEAAAACDGRALCDTMRSLDLLVSANLLQQPNDLDRFRCHELLREFAARRIEVDEPADTRTQAQQRMLAFYVASATTAATTAYPDYLPPPGQPDEPSARFDNAADALDWLHRERTNLTAAIRDAHESGHHDLVWRLNDPVTLFLHRTGRAVESQATGTLAVRSAHTIAHREGESSALIGLGLATMAVGDYPAAQPLLEAALRIVAEHDLERGRTTALHGLGRLAVHNGDSVAALGFFATGLALAQGIGDRRDECLFHCGVGEVLRTLDRQSEAITHLRQARRAAQRAGDKPTEVASLTALCDAFVDLGDHVGAVRHGELALSLAESIPDLAGAARLCVRLSRINADRRQFAAAVRYGRRAVATLRGSQDVHSQAQAAEALGDALFVAGEQEEAARAWRAADDRYEYTGAVRDATRVHGRIDSTYALRRTRAVPLARGSSATHDVIVDAPRRLSQPGRYTDG